MELALSNPPDSYLEAKYKPVFGLHLMTPGTLKIIAIRTIIPNRRSVFMTIRRIQSKGQVQECVVGDVLGVVASRADEEEIGEDPSLMA